MRSVRRHDHTPRLEMLPLIDVIFLLITYFIYAMVLMVEASVLPVKLAPLRAGEAAVAGEFSAITIDRAGRYYFNREPIDVSKLDALFERLAADSATPTLFIAMEQLGTVDRGPMLVDLIDRTHRAGITDIRLVGPPKSADAPLDNGVDD